MSLCTKKDNAQESRAEDHQREAPSRCYDSHWMQPEQVLSQPVQWQQNQDQPYEGSQPVAPLLVLHLE